MRIDEISEMRQWNDKCPKCGARILFRLYNGKLGASARAQCSKHFNSSRSFSRTEIKSGTADYCDWVGEAVRMWDGSVRFREKGGRYLFEWER